MRTFGTFLNWRESLSDHSLRDQSYALDLLIIAFVTSGVVSVSRAKFLGNLRRWQQVRPKDIISRGMASYVTYSKLNEEHLQAWELRMLLLFLFKLKPPSQHNRSSVV